MKNSILFSVVIPTYNSQKTIINTLRSIEKQIYKNLEVIIVDDGSTDSTIELIEDFESKNSINIKLLKQNNSGGPAKPRNLGIAESKGTWICFLDSDDFWFSHKLNDIFLYLKDNSRCDVISSNEVMIYNKKFKRLIYGPSSENFYEDLLENGNKLSTSATCVKRSFLDKNNILFREDIKFSSVEDYDFWLQIAKNKGNFKFLEKFHGIYLLNEDSISKNRVLHFQNTRNVINYHLTKIKEKNEKLPSFFKIKSRVFKSFLFISIKEKNNKLLFKIIINIFKIKI